MNKEQQRIKIAEACGYGGYIPLRNSLGKPNCHLPDYLNDLNAMHEAEVWLKPSLWPTYHSHVVECWIATARQRAEAFLKTLNL